MGLMTSSGAKAGNLVGIEGWLLVPAIGMAVAPLYLIVEWLGAPRDAWRHVCFAVVMGWTVYTAYVFFLKRQSARVLMMAYLLGTAGLVIGGGVVAHSLAETVAEQQEAWAELQQSWRLAGSNVLWSVYFALSERVRNTFVR